MHRYYDPDTGRYLTPDPIGLAGGINLFSYTHNNPVNYIDPDGRLAFLLPAVPAAAAALAKATAFVGSAMITGILIAEAMDENTENDTSEGETCPKNDKKKNQRGNPPKGEPGTWSEHPHGKQDRFYGPDGTPQIDIDYGHDHGQGQPHVHPWKNGVRGPGYPL